MPQKFYIPWIPAPHTIKRIDKIHTWLYKKTRGLIGSRLDGMNVLLLTTTGSRSGLQRCVPLPCFSLAGRTVLVGSFGGNPKDPAWVANVRRQPTVRVQRGRQIWDAQAKIAQGEERATLWSELASEYPRYAKYQTLTERLIPLVVIDPPAAS